MSKSLVVGMIILQCLCVGCSNYDVVKRQEWEQAYHDGKLSYYEYQKLLLLQKKQFSNSLGFQFSTDY